jgi:hypothetical protein
MFGASKVRRKCKYISFVLIGMKVDTTIEIMRRISKINQVSSCIKNNSTMNYQTIEFIINILTQKNDNGLINHFIRFEFQLHMDGFLKDISKAQNY